MTIARIAAATIAIAAAGPASMSMAASTPVLVKMVGRTQLTTMETPSLVQDTGTVKGSPVGSGNITLNYRLFPTRGVATVTWTVTNSKGTLSGTCRTFYSTTDVSWTFAGIAKVTGGTGAYRGVKAFPMQFFAKHSKLGRHEVIGFNGTASLPKAG